MSDNRSDRLSVDRFHHLTIFNHAAELYLPIVRTGIGSYDAVIGSEQHDATRRSNVDTLVKAGEIFGIE